MPWLPLLLCSNQQSFNIQTAPYVHVMLGWHHSDKKMTIQIDGSNNYSPITTIANGCTGQLLMRG